MKRSGFILTAAATACSAFILPRLANAAEKTETKKIEALITVIEGLKDASFIRNGRDYDSRAAAKFLRGKWEAQTKEINSAAAFIERVASVSSTTGQRYRIRFKDGKEVNCGEYLRAQLREIEKPKR